MPQDKNQHNITVLLTTYNRAEILHETLENMTVLDQEGIDIEYVVVDNNSTDTTKEVIESFSNRLTIRYLFEPRPGKNCALNKALDKIELGKIVVFTDDDVTPNKYWLSSIVSISKRCPNYSVFGGKIYAIPPNGDTPGWFGDTSIPMCNLAAHDYGDVERPYDHRTTPYGPNFWVRREVFDNGRRFNESIGPRPKNRIMGSETYFLNELSADGYQIMYSPYSVVGHRIARELISSSAIRKRAFRWGRSGPRFDGLCRPELFSRHPVLWRLLRGACLSRGLLRFIISQLHFSKDGRLIASIDPMRDIGYNYEAFRLANELEDKEREIK